jgi:hypothetical protein
MNGGHYVLASVINCNIVTHASNYTIDRYSSKDEDQCRICNDAKNKTSCVYLKAPVKDRTFEVCTGFFGFRFIDKINHGETVPLIAIDKLLESGI